METAQREALSETAVKGANPRPVSDSVSILDSEDAPRIEHGKTSIVAPFDEGRGNLDLARVTYSSPQVRGASNELSVAPRTAPTDMANQRFDVRGKWLGRVTQVGPETFWAVISDQREPRPDEVVEIPLDEIAPADRPLLREGAIFYWTIGYVDTLGGGRTRESVIRVQRRPGLTEDDLRAAQSWAARMSRLINRA